MRVALIDHYDSFTFNVIEWLAAADPMVEIDLVPFDDDPGMRRLAKSPLPTILSPGPNRPEDATSTLELTRLLLGQVPILGICLGHQILGVVAGASVVRSRTPHHGATRSLTKLGTSPLLAQVESGASMGVYHSLVIARDTLPSPWRVDAVDELGEVQALSRQVPGQAPAFGLQFHPESHLSPQGASIARQWLALTTSWPG